MRTATAVTAVLLGILACAQAAQYAFQADFVHRESKFGEGQASGTMYYRHDTSNGQNNVIHYNYTAPTKISVIHVQKDERIYKRCGTECEGINEPASCGVQLQHIQVVQRCDWWWVSVHWLWDPEDCCV